MERWHLVFAIVALGYGHYQANLVVVEQVIKDSASLIVGQAAKVQAHPAFVTAKNCIVDQIRFLVWSHVLFHDTILGYFALSVKP